MKKAIIIGLVALISLCIGEVFARYYLGLGDPPLVIGDVYMDYIFAPNQKCSRFGNNIFYNNVSMRNDFDIVKKEGRSGKIFIVGDSVVNGGVLTDHKDLATSILQERMKIQVCNVSAGSWGPGNYAAYFF